jgi:serine/threonine protein phosphatase PrpC
MYHQLGFSTRKGCSSKNQDDVLIWQDGDRKLSLMAILDGHGYKGVEAAKICVETIRKKADENPDMVLNDPVRFFDEVFKECDDKFVESTANFSTKFAGGSTLSIAIVTKDRLFVANVGDSPIFLCASDPYLLDEMVTFEKDCATDDVSLLHNPKPPSELTNVIEVTRKHSADNLREFDRVCKLEGTKLHFLYDDKVPRFSKIDCPPLYDASFGKYPAPEYGYYKNVRKEFGCGVCIPNGSFLSMTRSIGDVAFKPYGVTHAPEIVSIDLAALPRGVDYCIVGVTDGVDDNWMHEHIAKFVTDLTCLKAVVDEPYFGPEKFSNNVDYRNGAMKVAEAFLARNERFATKNFGTDIDDASVVLLYNFLFPVL